MVRGREGCCVMKDFFGEEHEPRKKGERYVVVAADNVGHEPRVIAVCTTWIQVLGVQSVQSKNLKDPEDYRRTYVETHKYYGEV